MATPSTTYSPDHQSIGPERGFEDYDMLEESCSHDRHTLAGIDERAAALTGPYATQAQFDAERMDLLHDAVATVFGTWL